MLRLIFWYLFKKISCLITKSLQWLKTGCFYHNFILFWGIGKCRCLLQHVGANIPMPLLPFFLFCWENPRKHFGTNKCIVEDLHQNVVYNISASGSSFGRQLNWKNLTALDNFLSQFHRFLSYRPTRVLAELHFITTFSKLLPHTH